jgi:hypothetical protein
MLELEPRSPGRPGSLVYCQVAVNRSCAPLVRVIVPVKVWPATALVAPVAVRSEAAAKSRYEVEDVVPDAPTTHEPAGVNALFVPAQVMDTLAIEAVPEPVFVTVMYGMVGVEVTQLKVLGAGFAVKSAARRDVPVTATRAEFWPWAKMPKTKPPVATDAMRATAMISTVAMIGEMAPRLWPLDLAVVDVINRPDAWSICFTLMVSGNFL